MAYAPLPSKTASDTLTLSDYNKIKGNFEAGTPDIFAVKGDIAVATAADVAARLAVGANDSILTPDSAVAGGVAWQSVPACWVYRTTNVDPTPSSWVTLDLTSELSDTDGMHSNVTNPSRITIPAGGTGFYALGANVKFDAAAGTGQEYGVRLLVNGATIIAEERREWASTNAVVVNLAAMYPLTAADYVQLQVYTEKDVDVVAVSSYLPHLWAIWQRRQ